MHVVLTLRDIIWLSLLGIWAIVMVGLLLYYGAAELLSRIRRRWTNWRNSR